MLILTPPQRRELRAKAHHLHPVVAIGHQGLTEAVLKEIDGALRAHELIKVRVFSDERSERESLAERICAALECAPVQHLGKLLVLWRPRPPEETAAASPRRQSPRSVVPGRAARASRNPLEGASTQRRAGENASRRRRATGTSPPLGVPRAGSTRRRRRTH